MELLGMQLVLWLLPLLFGGAAFHLGLRFVRATERRGGSVCPVTRRGPG